MKKIFADYRYLRLRFVAAQFPKRRPAILRAIGAAMNPSSVTEAWYAAECPTALDTSSLPTSIVARWRVACWLRGVNVS